MGLDMYLKASKYLCKYGEKELSEQARSLFPEIKSTGNLDSVEVKFEVGYWRKANAIHHWFVDNVQDGVDECQDSDVYREDLEKLRDLCKQIVDGAEYEVQNIYVGTRWENGKSIEIMEDVEVLTDKTRELAEELLPTTSGFFFGGTEYTKWYIDDLKETIKIAEYAIELNNKGFAIEYHASW